MTETISKKSALLKKYLLKRHPIREEPLPEHSSIFRNQSEDHSLTTIDNDPFKKYLTLSTEADNSSSLRFSRAGTTSLPVKSHRGVN